MPLPTSLNVGEWHKALAGHLEFRFPTNYTTGHAPTPMFSNHMEDPAYAHHMTAYVDTKLCEGTLLGPFAVPLFTPL